MNILFNLVVIVTIWSFSASFFLGHLCKSDRVYSESNFLGYVFSFSAEKCTILQFDRIGSVISYSECLRLYSDSNCSGKFMEITPRSRYRQIFLAWDNYINAKSAGPCPNSCIENTRQEESQEIAVELFSERYYNGSKYNMKIKGCTKVPTESINFKSINTSGHCVQLYNNNNCLVHGFDVDTILLGPGTSFHKELYNFWQFPTIKSISLCSYNCLKNKTYQLPLKGEVTIYYKKRFQWYFNKINISSGNCYNILNYETETVESITTAENSCVSLFSQRNCHGKGYDTSLSIEDFSTTNFNPKVASVMRCSTTNLSTEGTTTMGNLLTEGTAIIGNLFTEGTTTISNSKETTSNEPDLTTFKHIKENESSAVLSPILISNISVLVSVSITLIVVVIVLLKIKKKNGIDHRFEKEVNTFISGLEMDVLTTEIGVDHNSKDYSVEILAQNKPYSREFEISRSRIKIDSQMPLGKGEFGVVFKGTVDVVSQESSSTTRSGSVEKITVAIKTTKPDSGLHGLSSMLKEVKVMLYMGRHANIAYLVGCCTENLRNGEIMVIMEFCAGGSMDKFFSKNRSVFLNLVSNGLLILDNASETRSITSAQLTKEEVQFDTIRIFKWCVDIARGMEFLSNAKVVHSDLAARNILLTENLQAKISDFGLSRQLYNYSQYMKKKREPLPWRWMAIESLKFLEFSTKSDVWSYGVLCWEMFTLGQKPYTNLAWDHDFVSQLENGLRLTKPNFSTDELYVLMRQCWSHDSKLRPDFAELADKFKKMIEFSNRTINDNL